MTQARLPDAAQTWLERYPAGFVTAIATRSLPPGLNEATIRALSALKGEPEWLLDWRLAAFARWATMTPPGWAHLKVPELDLQALSYHAAPEVQPRSLDDLDPALLAAYNKLGIPLHERARLAGVAVEAVFDSVSLGTTHRDALAAAGVLFCSMSEAVRDYPDLVQRYLGSVVGPADNYYAALNAAVFSDGSFVFVPKGVRCPLDLSTYFRINAGHTGQFERTLIVAEAGAQVSYLEGCTAPMRSAHQLHAAVVEIVALKESQVRYSTVQNWYPGDAQGRGGILNFVTKRAECRESGAQVHWAQVEVGSAITWKYPSCVLRGRGSVGTFQSVALTHHHQQADTGTKMVHLAPDTRSTVLAKGISAGASQNTYRGLVHMGTDARHARNHTQCDSLLIGAHCGAHTFPSIESRQPTAIIEHEATTTRLGVDQLFYCRSRGLGEPEAAALIVNGFCREVFDALPMEFALEARRLLDVSLEGAVG
jgi:Fe-S cluster assembly protein SufB